MNWIFEVYKIIDSFIMFNVSYLIESTNYVINEIYHLDYNNIATKIFLSYVETKVRLNRCGNYLYANNTNIQYVYDWGEYGIRYTRAFINNCKIEPKEDYWISLSIMFKNNDTYIINSSSILEDYKLIKAPQTSSDPINNEHCLKYFCETAKSIAETSDHIDETMITLKLPNSTLTRTFKPVNNINNNNDTEYSKTKSSVSLLSVVYSHPRMEEKIVMDLPPEYFYVNNEILSPLFIKRYLEYQPNTYIFDDTYTISIMDNMINMISLTSKNSILLKESTYTVTTNE